MEPFNSGNPVFDTLINIAAAGNLLDLGEWAELHKCLVEAASNEPGGLTRPHASSVTGNPVLDGCAHILRRMSRKDVEFIRAMHATLASLAGDEPGGMNRPAAVPVEFAVLELETEPDESDE